MTQGVNIDPLVIKYPVTDEELGLILLACDGHRDLAEIGCRWIGEGRSFSSVLAGVEREALARRNSP